jgi:hypothetical protein
VHKNWNRFTKFHKNGDQCSAYTEGVVFVMFWKLNWKFGFTSTWFLKNWLILNPLLHHFVLDSTIFFSFTILDFRFVKIETFRFLFYFVDEDDWKEDVEFGLSEFERMKMEVLVYLLHFYLDLMNIIVGFFFFVLCAVPKSWNK